jgi:hypothetical protein
MRSLGVILGPMLLATSVATAAAPPELVNYQGVLRDDSDKPLSGTYDMVFAFYDAPAPGGARSSSTRTAPRTPMP